MKTASQEITEAFMMGAEEIERLRIENAQLKADKNQLITGIKQIVVEIVTFAETQPEPTQANREAIEKLKMFAHDMK